MEDNAKRAAAKALALTAKKLGVTEELRVELASTERRASRWEQDGAAFGYVDW